LGRAWQDRDVAELLQFISRSILHLSEVYGFVTVAGFSVSQPKSDAEVLGALIKTAEFEGPGYDVRVPTAEESRHFAAFAGKIIGDPSPLHGPYRLSEITVDSYQPTTTDHARAV
jgi:hypothetical protein